MVRPRTLRFRMMALFCCVVGVLLAGLYLALGMFLAREVREQLDRQLLATAEPVIADLITDPADEQDVNQLDVPDGYFELLDPSVAPARILQASRNLQGRPLDLGGAALNLSEPVFRVVSGPKRHLRMALIPFERANHREILVVAAPNHFGKEILDQFAWIMGLFLPLSLVLTAWISTWYVRRSLAPVAALTAQARQVMDRISTPDRRALWTPLAVEDPDDDELGSLAATFNELFSRIDSVLGQLRQFVTDASHELRTPLSVLRGETELLLAEPRNPEEYQRALQIMDGELQKLTRMVEGLFTLSVADAGQLQLVKEPLYLNEALEEACLVATPAAQKKDVTVLRDLKKEVACCGDEAFLRELFLIFLDNAIKYSRAGSAVHVRLEVLLRRIRISFEDEGIGISSADLPHIFERFYRVGSRPAGEAQSGGLGLAIAQALVAAQGGTIECRSVLGQGSTFTVSLPVTPDAEARAAGERSAPASWSTAERERIPDPDEPAEGRRIVSSGAEASKKG
ncbi:MAG TPA: HAMP domain-containing sensor histidine kinase [Terriglobia bacterium]|nr:HAMP domain-containing sensor histidine kinase [Terriglobia bacterium]